MAVPVVAIPIIGDLLKAGMDIINKFVPDKDLAAKLQQELLLKSLEIDRQHLDMAAQEAQAQASINQTEAASDNIFVAGWRPVIGWVCGIGFLYQFVVYPTVQWYIAFKKVDVTPPPTLDGILMELTFALLGLGAFRTYEKVRGISAKAAAK